MGQLLLSKEEKGEDGGPSGDDENEGSCFGQLGFKTSTLWGIAYHETGSSELAFKGRIRPEILAWASTAQISQLTVE